MQMVAEDDDLSAVFLSVMRRHIPTWPARGAQDAPVWVRSAGSADQAFQEAAVILKMTNLKVLGILVDAEQAFASRWARIKTFCQAHFPGVPTTMPAGGLILANSKGQKFGVWVMPNNKSPGMLETFCKPLVSSNHQPLWEYALEAVQEAKKKRGADFKNKHLEKAHLHTFLAWMNPPGQRLGEAVISNCLDCHSAPAMTFVKWCKDLYDL